MVCLSACEFSIDVRSYKCHVDTGEEWVPVLRRDESHSSSTSVPDGNHGALETSRCCRKLEASDDLLLFRPHLMTEAGIEGDDNKVNALVVDVSELKFVHSIAPTMRGECSTGDVCVSYNFRSTQDHVIFDRQ